jgi:hypothetical protein
MGWGGALLRGSTIVGVLLAILVTAYFIAEYWLMDAAVMGAGL